MWQPKTSSLCFCKTLLLVVCCQILLVKFSSLTVEAAATAKSTSSDKSKHHQHFHSSAIATNISGRIGNLKREPDPFDCQWDKSVCDAERGKGNNENVHKKLKNEKKKNLEEAKAIAKKSANKLLEILQKFGEAFNGNNSSSQMMSSEEFVALLSSANAPMVQLFGGPFGTVFTGVRESLVTNTDPVLKSIAELNAELDRQFDADADRLDEMIRLFKRLQLSSLCYNGEITCLIDMLQPFYNALTSTPAIIDDPKTYNKTVNNFMAVCNHMNLPFSVLSYIRTMYGDYLWPIYYEKQGAKNLLSAAKVILIHALKVTAMTVLCGEFHDRADFYDHYATEDMGIILNHMGHWIQTALNKNPPSTSPPPDSSAAAVIHHHNHFWHSNLQQLAIVLVTNSLLALACFGGR